MVDNSWCHQQDRPVMAWYGATAAGVCCTRMWLFKPGGRSLWWTLRQCCWPASHCWLLCTPTNSACSSSSFIWKSSNNSYFNPYPECPHHNQPLPKLTKHGLECWDHQLEGSVCNNVELTFFVSDGFVDCEGWLTAPCCLPSFTENYNKATLWYNPYLRLMTTPQTMFVIS